MRLVIVSLCLCPHGLVKLLGLEGGCELVQAAIRQNKEKTKLSAPKQPKPSSRSGRSTRSMSPYAARAGQATKGVDPQIGNLTGIKNWP